MRQRRGRRGCKEVLLHERPQKPGRIIQVLDHVTEQHALDALPCRNRQVAKIGRGKDLAAEVRRHGRVCKIAANTIDSFAAQIVHDDSTATADFKQPKPVHTGRSQPFKDNAVARDMPK